jgi:hypothetical protein
MGRLLRKVKRSNQLCGCAKGHTGVLAQATVAWRLKLQIFHDFHQTETLNAASA